MNRQLALGMLLTLTLGAAVYEWAWLPYRHAVSSLEASVQDAQRAFDWAETTIAQIKRAPNVGEGGPGINADAGAITHALESSFFCHPH